MKRFGDELAAEEKMPVTAVIEKSIEALAPKLKPPPELISVMNPLTREFKKTFERDAQVLLYNGELIIEKLGSGYITNMQFKIDIMAIDKSRFPKVLPLIHEFAKLNLAPEYIVSIRSSVYYLKQKIYPMNLLRWLQQGPKEDRVKKKLEEVTNAIDKFRNHNLSHLNLALTNIILKEGDTIAFTNFGEAACTKAVSQTLEYSHLANNVYALIERKKIDLEHKDIVYNWLFEKLGQDNNMENIRSGHYINIHKSNDENVLKVCHIPSVEEIRKLKAIETTNFYRHFIEGNYDVNALTNLTSIPIKTITCISHMKKKIDKAWIFVLNEKYIVKLTRCGLQHFPSAKYEILMHLKFMEAEKTLKKRMAPTLLAYNTWKLPFSKDTCVGWISEKIRTLTDSMETKADIPVETIEIWFTQIRLYYERMCQVGLWHFDSHIGNWGFVDAKIVLFDFEFASNNHDVQKCDWTHEIATFAHGLNSVWENYERLNSRNMKLFAKYFHKLQTDLYQKQKYSVMEPLHFDATNPRACLQISLEKDEWFFRKRISPDEKIRYCIAHLDDWKPFKFNGPL